MSQDRLPVVPMRLTLQTLKQKLASANRGHVLLKKKSDALTIRFRSILKTLIEKKEQMGIQMREAAFSLAAAKFAIRDSNFQHVLIENVESATYRLRLGVENAVGVQLPIFEPSVTVGQSKEYTGLGQGGSKIKVCRNNYIKVLDLLTEIASLQTTFVTLDQVIKVTNRRVNAIEYVVKPRLVNTIAFVEVELEEMEREEMFRLKKIQQKKEKEMALKQEQDIQAKKSPMQFNEIASSFDIINTVDDVVF